MNALITLFKKTATVAAPQTLDGLFAEIAKNGRLALLMQHRDGDWTARIEIPTSNPAIQAEISAVFGDHFQTPHQALNSILVKTKASS